MDESKNVQTTPTRTYCKCSRPLPYCNPNCRTPRNWKFTQHHRTTRPPQAIYGWLVGWFGFNGPLRQYFSLYRAVSQREGERGEKGQMRVKMSKQPPHAPTASAVGPCPTVIKIVGRPGTGSLPSTIAPPDHSRLYMELGNNKSGGFRGEVV